MPIPINPPPTVPQRFGAPVIDRAAAAVLGIVRRRMAAGAWHADAELLKACLTAADLWQESSATFSGPTRITDDDERDLILRPLWAKAEVTLGEVSDLPATTLLAHRARAAVLLEWDAGALVHAQDAIERRLILALAADLLRVA